MNSIVPIYVFVMGLCIGSFLNVVALRGLSGEDFVFSRSKCPKCNNLIKWYMNIPLVSYIFLRGKCAYCKEKISIQYPIVEFITGCAFLACYLVFGLTFKTLFICLFLCFFILLSLTDILETVIITTHAYILLAIALICSIFKFCDVSILQALIAAVLGFLIFEGVARLGYLIVNYRIFGEGDSYIAMCLGAIFGFKGFIIVACLSVLIQSLISIPLLMIKTFKNKNYRMFISYLLVGVSIFLVFYLNYFSMIKSQITYIGVVILITTFLLWSLKNILSSIKNKKELDYEEAKEKFSIFPFGPAMLIAGTIAIFYLPEIKTIIKIFIF